MTEDGGEVEVVVVYEYAAQLPDELSLRVGDVIQRVERLEGGWWRGQLAGRHGMFPDNFVKVLTTSSSSSAPQSGSGVTMRTKKKCRVLFSYQPVHDDELELQADQVLEFLGEVEDGWWKGRAAGRVGVFPSNFVEMCSDKHTLVEERNNKNLQSANLVKEPPLAATESTKEIESTTAPSPPEKVEKGEEPRKMSASQRSQIGPDTPPPDTAPRLPPKPVKEQCLVLFPYTAQNEDELTLQEGQTISIITKDCEDKGWWKGELDGRVGVFPDNFVKRVSQHLMTPEDGRPPPPQLQESPEKPKFPSLKPSPSRDNIKKVFETSGTQSLSSSVLSKATSFEKLKVDKLTESAAFKLDEDKKNSENNKSNKISEMNKKVSNIKNELSKNELFNKPHSKTESSSKINLTRSSLGSNLTEKEPNNMEAQRRTSEPPQQEELDEVLATTKLNHPTASRVKAPKRRPPSQQFLKESIPDVLIGSSDEKESQSDNIKATEESEKVVETEEVSNKTKIVDNPLTKPIGAVQVMPTLPKQSGTSPDTKPSWMEEFSRKKANRKSGIFADKQESGSGDDGAPGKSPQKTFEAKLEKPSPPKADTKPSIASKPDSDISEIRKSFSRDKSQQKQEAAKPKPGDEVEKRPERTSRPSLPASLVASSASNVSKAATEAKRNSDIVRHSSETGSERKVTDLSRKHSDSSRHSDKAGGAAHSANLGNPDKFSFAKPERPSVVDKVLTKNDKNNAKSELPDPATERPHSGEHAVGWKSDIISSSGSPVPGILAAKETNGFTSNKEKENISNCRPACKELQELKNCMQEMQTEFQLQVKSIRRELDDERQARIKLEAEVKALKKLVNK